MQGVPNPYAGYGAAPNPNPYAPTQNPYAPTQNPYAPTQNPYAPADPWAQLRQPSRQLLSTEIRPSGVFHDVHL